MSEGTKKVTRVVTEYKTLNSTYQVDREARQFRRVEGVNPALVGPDGEWVDYSEVVADSTVGGLLIAHGNSRILRTSPVLTFETIALTD